VKRGPWSQRGWTDALLVPIYGGDGHVWSMEAINADDSKDTLKDAPKRGGFHPLGKIRGASRVLIAEGLANAAVGRAVDSSPGAAAMVKTNLLHAALAVRKLCPRARSSSSPTTV
jgi:putative DNA primase/helicase